MYGCSEIDVGERITALPQSSSASSWLFPLKHSESMGPQCDSSKCILRIYDYTPGNIPGQGCDENT
jgi:hypothetical protein